MSPTEQCLFLLFGYCVTVSVELPILHVGLCRQHPHSDRVTAGFLLTAFTYPMVILVLPGLFTLWGIHSRTVFLLLAETYAPMAEILFFRYFMNQRLLGKPDRDAVVIIAANLSSFLLGELFLSGMIHTAVESVSLRI